MSALWREVRVFISSTFRDMQAERDYLVRFVFPRLREELLKRRIHLVDVDLRWGVTADQDVFDLCRDEIERCHPRFICILGGRYGWIPPPKIVPAELIERIVAGTSAAGRLSEEQRESLASLYVRAGPWFRLRERPREETESETWEQHAAIAADLFQAAGLAEAGQSITASEVHLGALAVLDKPTFRYFYFRNKDVTNSIPGPHAADYCEKPGSFAEQALEALKARIRQAEGLVATAPGQVVCAPLPVYEYPCAWDAATDRITELGDFGNRVYEDLLRSVEAQFGGTVPVAPDVFAEERAALEAFVEARAGRYVIGSRKQILDALLDHAGRSGGNGCLCVVGEPGSGKSALAAKFYRDCAVGGDRLVVPHFTGINSTGVRELVLRLCHELASGAGLAREIPADYEGLLRTFPEVLEEAAGRRRVVLLIDAVNQLEMADTALGMLWLPERLPSDARIILTSLPGPVLDALRARRNPPAELNLKPLDERDASAIIGTFLERYRKEFDPDQRAALLSKEDSGNPLYLLTALEELRTLGTYELLPRIREMPAKVRPLFDWILNRLEGDPGFRDEQGKLVGPDTVERYCPYLSLGRSGMAQSELVDLVAPGDPQGNLAAVRALLLPYLMRRGELLDFFHGQIREAVLARYLSDDAKRGGAHAAIARYFAGRADPRGDGTWDGESPRGPSELPFHLTEAGDWDALYRVLTDFRFLERKARLGLQERTDPKGDTTRTYTGVFLLQDDFDRALRKMPGGVAGGGPSRGRPPIIVTSTDDGKGPVVRCPFCNRVSPVPDGRLGTEIECPSEGCGGRLKVNPFVVKQLKKN